MVVNPDLIRKAVEMPDELAIVIGIALGYADEANPQNAFRSSRRSLEDIAHFRGF
ncbi:MAG: hypothetical protein ACYC6O_02820 [Thermoleophilia bacterium]